MSAKANKKEAAKRAAAMRERARFRLQKGRDESELILGQAGANQTSQAAGLLSRGVSERASIVNQSLDEIAKRAQFASNQALSDAQYEANLITSDAEDTMSNARDAQRAEYIGQAGTILSMYGKYYDNKNYGG